MEPVLIAGLVGAWLAVVVLGLVAYQLILQNGRNLLRLEDLELRLAEIDEPDALRDNVKVLEQGVPAPPIQLPDLNGTMRTLSEWRGRRVLLVFADPACGFSRTLAPYLAGLQADVVPGRPVPVVISTGDREENRRLFDGAGFTGSVLLQSDREIAEAYRVDGTPMSYLIEADGTVASRLAAGVQATLILAGEIATVADATTTAGVIVAPGKPVAKSLTAGDTAPVFRLPALDGGDLSLLEYRGRQVLVVFSDPEGAPCDDVARDLETHYRKQPYLPIVMISRGDVQTNRAKAQALGLSFPVVLQRHWEISRDYGMFATPVAFLVDEWGVIATDVAVGQKEIRALLGQAS